MGCTNSSSTPPPSPVESESLDSAPLSAQPGDPVPLSPDRQQLIDATEQIVQEAAQVCTVLYIDRAGGRAGVCDIYSQ